MTSHASHVTSTEGNCSRCRCQHEVRGQLWSVSGSVSSEADHTSGYSLLNNNSHKCFTNRTQVAPFPLFHKRSLPPLSLPPKRNKYSFCGVTIPTLDEFLSRQTKTKMKLVSHEIRMQHSRAQKPANCCIKPM